MAPKTSSVIPWASWVFKAQSREGNQANETPLPLYRQEVAAYELSEATGLGLIPPTVERRMDDAPGSLQVLMGHPPRIRKSERLPGTPMPPPGVTPEVVMPEAMDLERGGLGGPSVDRTDFDKLMAFDRLFRNRDRSPANLMAPMLGLDNATFGSVLWKEGLWQANVTGLLRFVRTSPQPSAEAHAWVQGIDSRVVETTLRTLGYPPEFVADALVHIEAVKRAPRWP